MPTPLPLVQPIESVTRTGTGSTARWESSRYLYDAQNRLSRQIEGAGGSTPEHLIYLEGYEDRVGGYRTRSYVDDYAHVTRYRYGQLELRFVLTDRLGSVVGVVRADRENTSSPLTVESTLAYDVFGTPRNPGNWAPLGDTESWPQATPPGHSIPTTRHGFTGHEMLSKQRLIHMRGRLFDPRMGRFTGVDPVIQFPLNTQGLNPYSYLLNNPLAGTDPTGYVACSEVSTDTAGSGTCDITQNGKTSTVGYAVGAGGVAVGGTGNMAAVSGAVSMGVLATSTGTMRSVSNGAEAKQTATGVQRTDRLADKGSSGLGSTASTEPSWATRAVGVGRAGAGALGLAATGVVCESGILCGVATSVLGTMSVDAIYTGAIEAWTGLPQDTQFAKALMSTGMSNRTAGYTEIGIGLLAGGMNVWANSAKIGVGTANGGLATSADEAVFWSGIGRGGADRAASWAAKNGGVTLESTLASRGIVLPLWDAGNPAAVAAWRQASIDFASGAKGSVRVLQGNSLRLDAIWRDEFRALQANPSVNSIRAIGVDSEMDALLWKR